MWNGASVKHKQSKNTENCVARLINRFGKYEGGYIQVSELGEPGIMCARIGECTNMGSILKRGSEIDIGVVTCWATHDLSNNGCKFRTRSGRYFVECDIKNFVSYELELEFPNCLIVFWQIHSFY